MYLCILPSSTSFAIYVSHYRWSPQVEYYHHSLPVLMCVENGTDSKRETVTSVYGWYDPREREGGKRCESPDWSEVRLIVSEIFFFNVFFLFMKKHRFYHL